MKKRHFKIKPEWVERLKKMQSFNLKENIELEYQTTTTSKFINNPLGNVKVEIIAEEHFEEWFSDENGIFYPKKFIDLYYDEISE